MYIIRNLLRYIISPSGLDIIKPQENARRSVMRYNGGKPPLMIYTALSAMMIRQACGLDKQKTEHLSVDKRSVFDGCGGWIVEQPMLAGELTARPPGFSHKCFAFACPVAVPASVRPRRRSVALCDRCHSLTSLHPPQAALGSLPRRATLVALISLRLLGSISLSQPNEKDTRLGVFRLVAEVGFEPHDLRVMSPTSYQAALLRDIIFSIWYYITFHSACQAICIKFFVFAEKVFDKIFFLCFFK